MWLRHVNCNTPLAITPLRTLNLFLLAHQLDDAIACGNCAALSIVSICDFIINHVAYSSAEEWRRATADSVPLQQYMNTRRTNHHRRRRLVVIVAYRRGPLCHFQDGQLNVSCINVNHDSI